MQHMFLIVLSESPNASQHHMGGLIADGTVGGIGNDLSGVLNQVNVLQGGGTVQHPLDENGQLPQPNPAGNTFSTGLCVAQPQKIQGHVHRAQTRLAGVDPPLHIPVQAIEYRLRTVWGFDG